MEQSLAEGVGFERVGAAEIDRRAGRRFDEKQARDGVHLGVDHTARQRQAMLGRARHDELHARFRPHFDLADAADGDEGAGGIVGLQPVAHAQAARGGEPRRADERTRAWMNGILLP